MSDSIWKKLTRSKAYREAFVGSQVKRTIPFQIRTLRKQHEWSQAELAGLAGVTQGVVSRAEDPDYGNLSLNTIIRIAAGFDCAFIGRFVPFSRLVDWYDSLSESTIHAPSFEEDCEPGHARPVPEGWQRGLVAITGGGNSAIYPSVRSQLPLPFRAPLYLASNQAQIGRRPSDELVVPVGHGGTVSLGGATNSLQPLPSTVRSETVAAIARAIGA